MSSSVYRDEDGINIVTKRRYGDSDISMKIHAEKRAKTSEWENDVENIFKSKDALSKHVKELTHALISGKNLSSKQIEYLDYYVSSVIENIPEHMINPKNITYINKVIQSTVTEYLSNTSIRG